MVNGAVCSLSKLKAGECELKDKAKLCQQLQKELDASTEETGRLQEKVGGVGPRERALL